MLFRSVYALGRVHMKLIHRGDRGDRTVEILNTPATDYDWNTGGGFFRNSLIEIERFNYMLNDNHGFKVYYYGVGKLNW